MGGEGDLIGKRTLHRLLSHQTHRMKLSVASAVAFAVLALNADQVQAGPIAMGLCYTACNAGYVTCCVTAGAIAGTFTLGLGIPAAVAACSVIQGACMAACTPLLVVPTP
ncbi:hypothetical protein RSOLAG1IB_02349 [Rhizoctonia solani AG-1 IB]|uniref:Cysteine-rich protein n=1 Tax=Thanatephorus cucumeris (strain AG1-IB / isolate 7/3/14) TaxID=1108050 RepID=A0A0B7FI27_THACB|nr:hypothetical protein RSOLAG1IB_02349 [Rhizoctonia solani AG-1 IB]